MIKIIKNVIKSIAITCLVLEIIAALYYGIYYHSFNKAWNENEENFDKYLQESGQKLYDNNNMEVTENRNKEIGFLAIILPFYVRFEITTMIAFFSIMLGTVIGAAISMREKTKKTIIITYLIVLVFDLLVRIFFEFVINGTVNKNRIVGDIIDVTCVYTMIFVSIILFRKVCQRKISEKVKTKKKGEK